MEIKLVCLDVSKMPMQPKMVCLPTTYVCFFMISQLSAILDKNLLGLLIITFEKLEGERHILQYYSTHAILASLLIFSSLRPTDQKSAHIEKKCTGDSRS